MTEIPKFHFQHPEINWSIHVPLMDEEVFTTTYDEAFYVGMYDYNRSCLGKPVTVKQINIVGRDPRTPPAIHWVGLNVKNDGTLGSYHLGGTTTAEEVKSKCPKTWEQIEEAKKELTQAIVNSSMRAIAHISQIGS